MRHKLVYCATPSRLAHLAIDIMDYVSDKGYVPFQPLIALPREFCEEGNAGRDGAIDICLAFVETCPKFWLFGISEGTLKEIIRALEIERKPRLINGFDTEREKFYAELGPKFGYPLKGLSWLD